ncbi:pentatricopeptide repeat-containing protein At3g29230-like [Phragmites australis]|uniref:pentatricopeptide repeat-containing protein At3g29230-like n=1 Tax=Phragmites australis TaxID=29695 RepID=UPI002D7883DD|nr:pentatricopeptide repeat-containing protein At3g29230-like [Phragmites australis]
MSLQLPALLPHLLKDCSRKQLDQIHGLLLTSSSLHRLPALLVRRATELGDMAHADLLFSSFRETEVPDVVLYNAMIRGCAYHGPHERALELFGEMPRRGLAPDSFTYPYVVDACARLRMWRRGEEVHCQVLKEGVDAVPAVGSSLLAFYVARGSLGDARRVFDGFHVKSVGLSNRMMSEYIKVGDVKSAQELFDAMVDKDVVSWNSMLAAYVKVSDIVAAKELFATMAVKNIVSWTTMLRALSDAGDFVGMRSLFNRMPERNLVSWNCILSSYTRHGRFRQALQLFPRMLLEGFIPDSFTVVSVLSACENLRKLRLGRWIHANLVIPALQVHAEVGTALVEMYAMCGDIARALVVFFKMDRKDVFSWNVMIRALAVHSRADDAFRLFDLMRKQDFRPNHFTFMGVLLACRYGSLVDEGRRVFDMMQRDYGIRPSLQHYGCLIDLLSHNGHVDEAVTVLQGMPCQPNSEVWRALLGGCRIHVGLGSAERPRRV